MAPPGLSPSSVAVTEQRGFEGVVQGCSGHTVNAGERLDGYQLARDNGRLTRVLSRPQTLLQVISAVIRGPVPIPCSGQWPVPSRACSAAACCSGPWEAVCVLPLPGLLEPAGFCPALCVTKRPVSSASRAGPCLRQRGHSWLAEPGSLQLGSRAAWASPGSCTGRTGLWGMSACPVRGSGILSGERGRSRSPTALAVTGSHPPGPAERTGFNPCPSTALCPPPALAVHLPQALPCAVSSWHQPKSRLGT